ncbi:MAG: DUF1109 domain-containing protein [Pseudomonadota bacterium]
MNNSFIDTLVEDAAPVRRADGTVFGTVYAGGFLAALAVTATVLGVRPDIGTAMGTGIVLWKFAASGIVALLGAFVLMRAGLPARNVKGGVGYASALVALLFAVPLVAAIATAPEAQMSAAANTGWAVQCLMGITAATVPMWAAALVWLRRAAPTNLEQASWSAGLASASAGATAFALHCPFDEVAYVGLWYMVGIVGIAALTRLVLPRLIRW